MFASLWPDVIKGRQKQGYWSDGDQPPKTKKAGQNIGYADKRMHKYWHYKDIPFSPDGTKMLAAPAPMPSADQALHLGHRGDSVSNNIKSYDVVWLIHMVGDVHQPLHATSRFTRSFKTKEGDSGGNGVSTDCCGKLHSFWDGVVGEVNATNRLEAVNDAIAAAAGLPAAPASEAAYPIRRPGSWRVSISRRRRSTRIRRSGWTRDLTR